MEADQLKKDIYALFTLLEKYEEDVSTLETKIANLLEKFPIQSFEITGYEVYQAYEKKMPWYKLSSIEETPAKKSHAIFMLKNGDAEASIGYNMSSNSISFSVNGGAIRFFKLDEEDPQSKFALFIKRLLKLN